MPSQQLHESMPTESATIQHKAPQATVDARAHSTHARTHPHASRAHLAEARTLGGAASPPHPSHRGAEVPRLPDSEPRTDQSVCIVQ